MPFVGIDLVRPHILALINHCSSSSPKSRFPAWPWGHSHRRQDWSSLDAFACSRRSFGSAADFDWDSSGRLAARLLFRVLGWDPVGRVSVNLEREKFLLLSDGVHHQPMARQVVALRPHDAVRLGRIVDVSRTARRTDASHSVGATPFHSIGVPYFVRPHDCGIHSERFRQTYTQVSIRSSVEKSSRVGSFFRGNTNWNG